MFKFVNIYLEPFSFRWGGAGQERNEQFFLAFDEINVRIEPERALVLRNRETRRHVLGIWLQLHHFLSEAGRAKLDALGERAIVVAVNRLEVETLLKLGDSLSRVFGANVLAEHDRRKLISKY